MPIMLRTSEKARKIALKILGRPINFETKAQMRRDKKDERILIRASMMRMR